MERRCHSALAVILLLFSQTAWTQQEIPWDETAEKSFQYALQMFERASYERAARQFEKVAFSVNPNHRSSAALLMAAKASLLSRDVHRACSLVDTLLRRFPESVYAPEAMMVSARAREARKDYIGALRYYARASVGEDSVANACAIHVVALLPYISSAERSMLTGRLFREGVPLLQLQNLGMFLTQSDTALSTPASNILHRPILLALLSPLAGIGRTSETAAEVRDGMLIALEQFNSAHGCRAELELREVEGHSSVDGLASRLRPDAILLGTMSNDARQIIPKLAKLGIPVLLPLANDASLTDLDSCVFQLNTPLEQRARLLADYAYLTMDIEAVMVLETTDTYVSRMSKAFSEHWLEKGMQCETRRWRTYEELLSAVRKLAHESGGKTRLLVAPAISPGDIANILRAVESVRSDILVLGMGDWHHEEVLKGFPTVDVTFESDEPFDAASPELIAAREAFKKATGKPLSKPAMFGYDACRIALSVALQAKGNRAEFMNRMRDVFEGVRAPVNFTTGRSNACLSLFRSSQGRIEKLESFFAK